MDRRIERVVNLLELTFVNNVAHPCLVIASHERDIHTDRPTDWVFCHQMDSSLVPIQSTAFEYSCEPRNRLRRIAGGEQRVQAFRNFGKNY